MRVAREAGRRQVKEPPPICLTWVDRCAMLFEIVRRKYNGFTDLEMDRMDTRRAVRVTDGIRYGWHWLDVYHHRRELARGRDGLRLRDYRGATGRAHVFNRSHNGS